MENNEKIPGEVKLSEQNGKLTLEINGTAVPNICGYRMWVNPKDPLVVKLSGLSSKVCKLFFEY